jgi:hypothetical protein
MDNRRILGRAAIMQLKTAILVLGISANALQAQGTFHFEWHGSQNQIEGGFDTTWAEVMVPGTTWGSQLLLTSLSFSDFNGMVMSTAIDDYDISGGVSGSPGGWWFGVALVDWSRNVELTTYGDAQDHLGRFQEQIIPNQFFGDERGYWTVDFVPAPEPSAPAILGLGLLVSWLIRRPAKR